MPSDDKDPVTIFNEARDTLANTREFGEKYKDFPLLLVRKADNLVVAASRSYDYEQLLQVFLSKSPVKGDAEDNYMLQHGPAALQHAAKIIAETPSQPSALKR